MSKSWVIDETWTPIFVDSAMTGPARTSTNAAGRSVTSGASAARKASSSSTMMKTSESSEVVDSEDPDAATVSTWVANWPVRWTSRPAGTPGPVNVPRISSTTPCASGPPVNAMTAAWTSAWRACPSCETPRSATTFTLSMPRICCSIASIAALSSAVNPPSRAATRVAAARDTSWNGAAMAAACMLGVLAGRNPLVVSLATSLREGRSRTARIVTTIHATTIRNLKRTVNRPRLTKKLLNRSLLGTSRCGSCGVPRRRVRGIRTLGG